ncbi:hypothetical protein [Streptomyces sp. GbtcB6]|uniref:hypothetical protein n=1 Tax=Streptomyces sp. GbtcB6 TaxID=2824751 RepID=UPI001C2F6869|nr:hypothetical protein [Streptomyces sp. GbtcB6]
MAEQRDARRGRPPKGLDIPGLDPHLREFARDLGQLKGTQTLEALKRDLNWSSSEFSKAFTAKKLPSLALVVALAAHAGADPEEWRLRWAVAYEQLRTAGRTDLIPSRLRPSDRAALQAAAEEAEALLLTIEARIAESRRSALLRAEPLLAELDEDLPTTTSKQGRNAAVCWIDLTDYLRRLVLVFDPRPIPTGDDGHAGIDAVLPRLAGLADLTGLPEWRELADQLGKTFRTAQVTGWVDTDPTYGAPPVYGDEFAGYRARAGRIASELARTTAYLPRTAVLLPAAPVDRDRYDPPRSKYRSELIGSVALVPVAVLPLALFHAPRPVWCLVLGFLFLLAVGAAAGMRTARRD